MSGPTAAVVPTAAAEAMSVGLVSASGVSPDQAILSNIKDTIREIASMILPTPAGSPGPRIPIRCCLQTAVEIHIAEWGRSSGFVLDIVLPDERSAFLRRIVDPEQRRTAERLTEAPEDLSFLVDGSTVAADPSSMSHGQQFAARRSDVLIVVAANRESALKFVEPLARTFAFYDGLVALVYADREAAREVIQPNGGRIQTRPLEELRRNLIRARQRPRSLDLASGGPKEPPRWTPGGLFHAAMAILYWKPPTKWNFRLEEEAAKKPRSLPWAAEVEVLDERDKSHLTDLRSRFAGAFVRSGLWAIYYSDLYRTALLLILFFNVVAVGAALMGFLNHETRRFWHILEVVALSMLAATYLWQRWTRWNQKWIRHRLLAELLRPAPYFWAGGQNYNPPDPRVPDKELQLWKGVIYEYQSILRQIPPPKLHFTTKYIFGARDILRGYLAAQVRWHDGFLTEHWAYHKRIVCLGTILFLTVLIMAGSYTALLLLPTTDGLMTPPTDDAFARFLVGAACILGAIGFAGGVLVHQLGFERIAERSELTVAQLNRLIENIDAHQTAITYDDLARWYSQCAAIVQEELLSWFRQSTKITAGLS